MRMTRIATLAVACCLAGPAFAAATPPPEPTAPVELSSQDFTVLATLLQNAGSACDKGDQFACQVVNPQVRTPLMTKLQNAYTTLQQKAKK